MGYMGFGMRKEVYTRKPKKAFEKHKRTYPEKTKEIERSGEFDYEGLKTSRRNRFRHFFGSRLFWGILVSAVLIISVALMWKWFFEAGYKEAKRVEYEQTALIEYYNAKHTELTYVVNIFKKHERMISLGPDTVWGHMRLSILSPKSSYALKEQRVDRIFHVANGSKRKCRISKGKVIISEEGFSSKRYSGYWILNINLIAPEFVDESVLRYLGISRSDFTRMVNTIKKNHWDVHSNEAVISVTYKDHEFGKYKILFATEESYTPEEAWLYDSTAHALDAKIYWTR